MIFTKNYKYIEEHIDKYKNNEKFKNFVKATFPPSRFPIVFATFSCMEFVTCT